MITFALRPGFVIANTGTIAVGNWATAFNVAAALTAGGGTISTSDQDLANTLSNYGPLFRQSDDGQPLVPSVAMRLASMSAGNAIGLTDTALEVRRNGDVHPRWKVQADGTMSGGDGTTAPGAFALASVVQGANVPSTGEKAALVGTSGTPGSGNRYATSADTRLTDARAPSGPAGGGLSGTYPNPEVIGSPPPEVFVQRNPAQSILYATSTAILFNAEVYDRNAPAEHHSLVSNLNRVTCQVAGFYILSCGYAYENIGSYARAEIDPIWTPITGVPGSPIRTYEFMGSSSLAARAWTWSMRLSVGDYLELLAYQENSAAAARTVFVDFKMTRVAA